jgi:Protein of unknown function (DUF2935).
MEFFRVVLTMSEDQKNQIFEHRFWLRIMMDHLYIILNALNYREEEERIRAQSLIRVYNELLARIWDPLSDSQLKQLTQDAYKVTQEIRIYKLHILGRQLQGSISIAITSDLISRLTSEAECYLEILNTFLQDKKYVIEPIQLHLLWLYDAAGHAVDIANGFNFANAQVKSKTLSYQTDFMLLYIRATEMKGFFRTGMVDFPAFEQFNEDVNARLTEFTEFFVDLNFKIIKSKVPTTVTPTMLDHMYREECYYLTQLAKISNIRAPVCDPTVEGLNCQRLSRPNRGLIRMRFNLEFVRIVLYNSENRKRLWQ